ncbi:topoisomerase C-terminal repeat-containing protein [Clavibacter michiganensis]|uniref:topoisomerase C-terminal repeat-containing protein n=1 Tax=Clavibacter michiganensis TaxID=28447 RepID=UPI0037446D63
MPEDLAPDELTAAKARELIDAPVVTDRVIGINPENGKQVVAKDGRYGPYVTELDPEPEEAPAAPGGGVDPATGEVLESASAASTAAPAKKAPAKKPAAKKAPAVKPRTASIFKSMDLATVDLETALRLLDLPASSARTRRRPRPSPRRTASTART